MNKRMEQIISKDLGMDVEAIRCSSWSDLEKRRKRLFEQSFRPKNMFIVGGNIYLAEKREMGKVLLEMRNFGREAVYKLGCLRKRMKNV